MSEGLKRSRARAEALIVEETEALIDPRISYQLQPGLVHSHQIKPLTARSAAALASASDLFTTTCHLFSQYLAIRGYRCLLLDTDPQGSLSFYFGKQMMKKIAGKRLFNRMGKG